MKNNTNPKNIVSLLIILAILATYMYYIRPAQNELAEKRETLAQNEQLLLDLQNSVSELETLKSELPVKTVDKQALLAQIPSGVNQDGLIKDMNRLAQNRGIELKNIGFSMSPIDNETGIGVVTMSTGFEGTYQDLINLLSDMENNARKFRVKNISVQVLEVSRDFSAGVSFSLTIESYYQ